MSINLCKKKFKKRKNSSPLSKKIDISDKYIENRRLNTPIGELLYEDAFNKRQKLENMTLKEKKEIKKDGNKSLISKGSESLLFKKNELKLKEIIDRYFKSFYSSSNIEKYYGTRKTTTIIGINYQSINNYS